MDRHPLPLPSGGRPVLVWGNCQAAPTADLLRAPLAAAGCEIVDVPPVFLADADDVQRVRELLADAAALVSQPVRDEYATPGCGTRQLAALLPADARLVTFPVAFDTRAFPYQVNAHDGDGHRVTAPLTDYHDLRILDAAARGWSVDQTVDRWPQPSAEAVLRTTAASRAELRRREHDIDVPVSDLLDELGPDALFTITHPTNALLAAQARRILTALGLPDGPDAFAVPDREYLGERRAPLEPAVAAALDWSPDPDRAEWIFRGERLPLRDVVTAHLERYAAHPDIVADSIRRHADRRALIGLPTPDRPTA